MPDSNPFAQTNSTFGWFFDYENSIVFSESLRYTNVPPFDAQWKKLEQFEKNDPVAELDRFEEERAALRAERAAERAAARAKEASDA